jgi:hypothetical protein
MKEDAANPSAGQATVCGEGSGACPVLVQKGPGSTIATASDRDLASVVEAWPYLPAHIQAAVLALVKSVTLASSK